MGDMMDGLLLLEAIAEMSTKEHRAKITGNGKSIIFPPLDDLEPDIQAAIQQENKRGRPQLGCDMLYRSLQRAIVEDIANDLPEMSVPNYIRSTEPSSLTPIDVIPLIRQRLNLPQVYMAGNATKPLELEPSPDSPRLA